MELTATHAAERAAEDVLRAAALSMRSLCWANSWTTLTAHCEDATLVLYRVGHGLELHSVDGERVAFFPESALDDEKWGLA
jgi:hypothetical protein